MNLAQHIKMDYAQNLRKDPHKGQKDNFQKIYRRYFASLG